MYLWGCIVFLVWSAIILLGNIGTDINLYKYKKQIVNSTEKFLKDANIKIKYNTYDYIYVQELIDEGYLKYNKYIDKYCFEKVKVTNKLIFKYKYEIITTCK